MKQALKTGAISLSCSVENPISHSGGKERGSELKPDREEHRLKLKGNSVIRWKKWGVFFFLLHSIFGSLMFPRAANTPAKAGRSPAAVPAVFQRTIKLKTDTNLT